MAPLNQKAYGDKYDSKKDPGGWIKKAKEKYGDPSTWSQKALKEKSNPELFKKDNKVDRNTIIQDIKKNKK